MCTCFVGNGIPLFPQWPCTFDACSHCLPKRPFFLFAAALYLLLLPPLSASIQKPTQSINTQSNIGLELRTIPHSSRRTRCCQQSQAQLINMCFIYTEKYTTCQHEAIDNDICADKRFGRRCIEVWKERPQLVGHCPACTQKAIDEFKRDFPELCS